MITEKDLPGKEGQVILDLSDGESITLERRGDDLFYGQADNFDVEENGMMMVAKLNSWGARVIGWE